MLLQGLTGQARYAEQNSVLARDRDHQFFGDHLDEAVFVAAFLHCPAKAVGKPRFFIETELVLLAESCGCCKQRVNTLLEIFERYSGVERPGLTLWRAQAEYLVHQPNGELVDVFSRC